MSLEFIGSGSGTLGENVSTGNSTAALLTGGATFTGAFEDVSAYTTTTVSIIGTNALATGTLWFDVSHDGVAFGSIPRTITDITRDVPHPFLIAERYLRIRYVNDAVAQTGAFSLQTMFASARPVTVSRTVEEPFSINSDATLVRDVSSYDLDQARNLITGQKSSFFFGFNPDVGTAWEDIHPAGGDIQWQTSAVTVSISSTDAADTAAGLGAQSVELHGLSATGADQDEVIALNGTTEVDSTLTYSRVNKLHLETVGTYGGSHQGDITARVDSAGAKTGAILSRLYGFEGAVDSGVQYGSGEAGNGYWSVPLGKVMYITELVVDIDTGANKTADVILYEREGILNTTTPFDPRRILWDVQAGQGEVKHTFKSHIKVKGLTDLFFRAKGSASAGISVALDFYLLDANSDGK